MGGQFAEGVEQDNSEEVVGDLGLRGETATGLVLGTLEGDND
jgi:hypothetical protein